MTSCVHACSAVFFFITYIAPLILMHNIVHSGWRPTVLNVVSVFVEAIVIIGVCMSVCLHRFCAHRAFKTSRITQAIIVLCGCFAYQGNPIWWASKHVKHHKYCDLPQDPHSWKQTSFTYAFVGWTINPTEMAIEDDYVKHLKTYPELRVIGAMWWVWALMAAFTVSAFFGNAHTVVYVTTPMLLARLITLLFNVEYHPPERQSRFDASCRALDVPRILGNCVGESCHADHHSHPSRAKRPSGGFPYADLPYWIVIKPMLLLGLAWSPVDRSHS